MQNYQSIFKTILPMIHDAGEIILNAWNKPRQVEHKGAIDLVTSTDKAVESFLTEQLGAAYPHSTFLAEEFSSHGTLEEMTWVIDPLDGTTNFVHGFPFVAISIGLWAEGAVQVGVVYAPILGELFSAVRGQGCFLNMQKIEVSKAERLEDSLIATGFPYDVRDHLDEILGQMGYFLANTQGVRRPGAAAIDLAYIAAGRYDGFYELNLKPWDTAAGWLLVEEAGGKVTTFDSNEPYSLGNKSILASNGKIHQTMSDFLIGS